MDTVDQYIFEQIDPKLLSFDEPRWLPSSTLGFASVINAEFEVNGNVRYIKVLQLSISTTGSGLTFTMLDQTKKGALQTMFVVNDIVPITNIFPFSYLFTSNQVKINVANGAGIFNYSLLYQKVYIKNADKK